MPTIGPVINFSGGWELSQNEAILPDRPRWYILRHPDHRPFWFPVGDPYPSTVMVNTLIRYFIETKQLIDGITETSNRRQKTIDVQLKRFQEFQKLYDEQHAKIADLTHDLEALRDLVDKT